jgi:23S rRNA G2445 N2-methylase RlmL
VDFIVKNTLGKLLDGKSSRQAGKLTVLDPACGSGSFLIGAYEYLLQWYLEYYRKNEPQKWARGNAPALVEVPGNDWKLTIAERKRILLANIYGVDIDAQAVETTKLSLLLKVLEGETQQSLQHVFRLFEERALPDLGDNIKCGNSLVGPDFYAGKQIELINDEEAFRINVFDWSKEFEGIIARGGFDCIVGNPPYGFHQIHTDDVKEYFKARYVSVTGSFEHYFLFYEATLDRLAKGGCHGFIVPVTSFQHGASIKLSRT